MTITNPFTTLLSKWTNKNTKHQSVASLSIDRSKKKEKSNTRFYAYNATDKNIVQLGQDLIKSKNIASHLVSNMKKGWGYHYIDRNMSVRIEDVGQRKNFDIKATIFCTLPDAPSVFVDITIDKKDNLVFGKPYSK